MKIEEISKTSTFAWNNDPLPLLASGTVAGAVDADFSTSSSLEIWDIFSATNSKDPIFSALVDNRFYAIAWSKPFEGRSKGLLAGAFENGTIELWDVDELITSKDLQKASIFKSSAHSGPVKTLQFNPLQEHVLLSGGSNGQIFVWDTKKLSDPVAPGKAMTPMDEISCVSWNNSVSHIFATTGNSGYTSIWDLKSKREVLHLSYSANFSCVAWHPTQSTKLITATGNDNDALILTWDLKNANAPEKIMRGHKKGILSLDWCKQDPEILISSGKDNATMLWNPIKGEKLGEYPTTANWAFHTRFAPAAPEIFATASFDGKIVIQSLQDTSPPMTSKVTTKNDNDFWNEISTTETQQPVFTVHQAPAWLKRTLSVSFGFGSKLVLISSDKDGHSVVKLQPFVKNGAVLESTSKFSQALKSDDFKDIIEAKLSDAKHSKTDKADWEILLKLSGIGKEGFLKELVSTEPEQANGKKPVNSSEDGVEPSQKEDGDNDFFEQLGESPIKSIPNFVPEGKFSIDTSDQSEADKTVIKLLLSNKIEDAISACLDQKKLSAALVLALDASPEAKAKVRNAYFTNTKGDEIARLIYNASSKNITDIVANADVKSWKEIAAAIAAFSTDESDLSSKITELGDRIVQASENPSAEDRNNAMICYLAGNALEKIATIWLKELPEYEKSLLDSPADDISTPSDAHFKSLNNFMEKLLAYRSITKTNDTLGGPTIEPICNAILEYANLVAGYGQFELAQNFLQLLPSDFAGLKTEKDRISRASGTKAQVSNTRSTTSKATTTRSYGKSPVLGASVPPTLAGNQSFAPAVLTPYGVPAGQLAAGSVLTPATHSFPSIPQQPQAPVSNRPPVASTPSIYGKPAPVGNPYAPQGAAAFNPYKPPAPVAPEPVSAPPPAVSGPPKPSYRQETEGWNDLPEAFKQKTSTRRAAPAAVVSPSLSPALPANNFAPPKRNSTVSGPPPKGSRSSSRTTVPTVPTPVSPSALTAQLHSRYAPPPSFNASTEVSNGSGSPTPLVPAPPKNPYAPAATSSTNLPRNQYAPPVPAPSAPQPQTPKIGQAAATPSGPSPNGPPKNPYAPTAQQVSMSPSGMVPPRTGSYGAGPSGVGVPPPPPKVGGVIPPPGPVLTQPRSRNASTVAPVELTPPPTKPKYPAGDRSHIPEKSIQIYTSLDNLTQSVKPNVPERFSKHAEDMEKRLNFLYDHLNNDDLLSEEAISELKKVCSALEAKDYATATQLNVDFATNHSDKTGKWYPGLKRLISMAEATL